MSTLKERRERIEVEGPVHIPTLDGKGIAETIKVKVPAWRDPKDGEIYLDGEALEMLDRVKARHMGLLTPAELKAMRERLDLTQREMSELLQMGEKTWTRWESGAERPSRSLNVLLRALKDGKLTAAYLRSLKSTIMPSVVQAGFGQSFEIKSMPKPAVLGEPPPKPQEPE